MKKNRNNSPMGIVLVVHIRTKEQLYRYRAAPLAIAHDSGKMPEGNGVTIFLW